MHTQWKRSSTNKMIAGVAGGIAEAYGWDPTLVRLGFILLTLAHGIGLLLYLVLCLIMPRADAVTGAQSVAAGTEQGAFSAPTVDRNRTLGYLLVGAGVLMLVSMVHLSVPVMALMLVGGGWYLLRHR